MKLGAIQAKSDLDVIVEVIEADPFDGIDLGDDIMVLKLLQEATAGDTLGDAPRVQGWIAGLVMAAYAQGRAEA